MRFLVATAAVLALCGSAAAQTCVTSGSSTYCTNGVTGQQFGTSTYWSDGLSSHLSRQRAGSSYFSDGRTCTRFGNTVHCN